MWASVYWRIGSNDNSLNTGCVGIVYLRVECRIFFHLQDLFESNKMNGESEGSVDTRNNVEMYLKMYLLFSRTMKSIYVTLSRSMFYKVAFITFYKR